LIIAFAQVSTSRIRSRKGNNLLIAENILDFALGAGSVLVSDDIFHMLYKQKEIIKECFKGKPTTEIEMTSLAKPSDADMFIYDMEDYSLDDCVDDELSKAITATPKADKCTTMDAALTTCDNLYKARFITGVPKTLVFTKDQKNKMIDIDAKNYKQKKNRAKCNADTQNIVLKDDFLSKMKAFIEDIKATISDVLSKIKDYIGNIAYCVAKNEVALVAAGLKDKIGEKVKKLVRKLLTKILVEAGLGVVLTLLTGGLSKIARGLYHAIKVFYYLYKTFIKPDPKKAAEKWFTFGKAGAYAFKFALSVVAKKK